MELGQEKCLVLEEGVFNVLDSNTETECSYGVDGSNQMTVYNCDFCDSGVLSWS